MALKSTVSEDLQKTVAEHEHIDFVHFDSTGNHYLNVHKFEGKGKDEKENGYYGRIHVTSVVNKEGRAIELKRPIMTTKIVESVSREEILSATPVSNMLSLSTSDLSEKEIAYITKLREKNK